MKVINNIPRDHPKYDVWAYDECIARIIAELNRHPEEGVLRLEIVRRKNSDHYALHYGPTKRQAVIIEKSGGFFSVDINQRGQVDVSDSFRPEWESGISYWFSAKQHAADSAGEILRQLTRPNDYSQGLVPKILVHKDEPPNEQSVAGGLIRAIGWKDGLMTLTIEAPFMTAGSPLPYKKQIQLDPKQLGNTQAGVGKYLLINSAGKMGAVSSSVFNTYYEYAK